MLARGAFKTPPERTTMAVAKVEMYTKWGCPYCVMAKRLLDGKGVEYTE